MSSTGISNLHAEVPENVSKAVEAFALGELSLLEVRQVISLALEEEPARAEPIHELLDDELKARTLTIGDYGELVSAVGAVVSENVPTEWSEDAPDESGVYRVVDEGTLVPTNLSEWPEFQAHAAPDNNTPEVEDHTRPFGTAAHTPSTEAPSNEASADANEAAAPDTPVKPEAVLKIGPGTVLRNRFRLEEEVARGAMGVVFRATDLMKLNAGADDPLVAIKLVSPEIAADPNALRAFQNEFANTQHLSHPSIISVFELDQDGDQYFITMEWLDGQSLAALLDSSQGSALQPTQTYAIIEQLCDALVYAHEHNVVHADVKPGNVFLLNTGEVKLIDFGIARNESDLQDQTGDDSGDAVALTPAYASCERLEKQTPVPQDDLYSLASLIYRLLAGRRVFGPLTALEAEEQEAQAVPIGGMDKRRWGALSQALAFRRERRQSGIREFAEAFGRRIQPRTAEQEPAADETTQLPVLEAVPGIDGVEDIVLPEGAEVDFPLDADAAEAPEPELSGIFDAAALAGDGEEIVLTSEPEPVPQPIDFPPRDEKPAKPKPIKAKPVKAVIPVAFTAAQKQWAGIGVAALVVAAVLVAILSGDDEPARTVNIPEPVARVAQPESIEPDAVVAAPVAETEVATTAPEVEIAPVTEPEPETEIAAVAPEPEPAPVVEPEVVAAAPEVEIAPVTEPEPESEPAPVVEPEVVAAAPEVEIAPVTELEPESEVAEVVPEPAVAAVAPEPVVTAPVIEPEPAVVEAGTVEAGTVEAATVEAATVEAATVEAEPAQAELPQAEIAQPEPVLANLQATVPEPAGPPVPPPAAPESVALSELEFVKYAEPRYPRSAIERRYEGWVDLTFKVGTDGLPGDIVVADTNLPARFSKSSVDAIEKWRFEPFMYQGEPIAVDSAVRLRFAD